MSLWLSCLCPHLSLCLSSLCPTPLTLCVCAFPSSTILYVSVSLVSWHCPSICFSPSPTEVSVMSLYFPLISLSLCLYCLCILYFWLCLCGSCLCLLTRFSPRLSCLRLLHLSNLSLFCLFPCLFLCLSYLRLLTRSVFTFLSLCRILLATVCPSS